MIKLNEVVIVEGKYDKIRLSSLIDAMIIPTNGFGIFKDTETLELIKRLAPIRGLLILTDGDSAGFMIRSYIRRHIPAEYIRNAYIPDVYGKEKRKDVPSSEGKLGVEGMDTVALLEALRLCGVVPLNNSVEKPVQNDSITTYTLYELGFTGSADSVSRRKALTDKLHLPERISAKLLLQALNSMMTCNELKHIAKELEVSD